MATDKIKKDMNTNGTKCSESMKHSGITSDNTNDLKKSENEELPNELDDSDNKTIEPKGSQLESDDYDTEKTEIKGLSMELDEKRKTKEEPEKRISESVKDSDAKKPECNDSEKSEDEVLPNELDDSEGKTTEDDSDTKKTDIKGLSMELDDSNNEKRKTEDLPNEPDKRIHESPEDCDAKKPECGKSRVTVSTRTDDSVTSVDHSDGWKTKPHRPDTETDRDSKTQSCYNKSLSCSDDTDATNNSDSKQVSRCRAETTRNMSSSQNDTVDVSLDKSKTAIDKSLCDASCSKSVHDTNKSTTSDTKAVLMTCLTGDAASMVLKLTDAEVVTKCVDTLKKLFPDEVSWFLHVTVLTQML